MRATTLARRAIVVRGIVQGVGFRPFVYGLARRQGLTGFVRNDAEGVQIEIEGPVEELERFVSALRAEAPPLAVVEDVRWRALDARGDDAFRIEESRAGAQKSALVAADVATCADCLAELFDTADRRYRYPFINCTNCGPRFTITRAVPYDRAMTTMAGFAMCPACQAEYEDPADRRFHAQPNACPVCGPQARLVDSSNRELAAAGDDPLRAAAALLRTGAILAVKGLGGYHLACDPLNADAVAMLRARKLRADKPFALMARDLADVRRLCVTSPSEEALLAVPGRPIVLLEQRADSGVAAAVAPRQTTLGVMLAYTPLHHLLLRDLGGPLLMTSGNRSDEPIAYRDADAFEQLGVIADAFLLHDRPIHMRCDDSVTRVILAEPYPLRRSRGSAPTPLQLAESLGQQTLACGGELKNTFAVAKETHVFLSHHIGDLENYETLRSFREGIAHFGRLFDVQPALIAYDLHPEYLATTYALELEDEGWPAIGVQHHHAHIASCLADNERPSAECVIGVALDGAGYGSDGTLWGGEFLVGSIAEGFDRRAHLALLPLPGGAAAIREPWRMALGALIATFGADAAARLPLAVVRDAGERNLRVVAQLIERSLNAPLTSSAGRLFDAVAALVGVPGSQRVTYEGQAAIELELAAGRADRGTRLPYPCELRAEGAGWTIDTGGIITGVVDDLMAERSAAVIAARFHATLAQIVVAGCERLRDESGIAAVALSGGTFQNRRLLEETLTLLPELGFTVYRHRRVPANDGGLALGQVVLADHAYRRMNG